MYPPSSWYFPSHRTSQSYASSCNSSYFTCRKLATLAGNTRKGNFRGFPDMIYQETSHCVGHPVVFAISKLINSLEVWYFLGGDNNHVVIFIQPRHV